MVFISLLLSCNFFKKYFHNGRCRPPHMSILDQRIILQFKIYFLLSSDLFKVMCIDGICFGIGKYKAPSNKLCIYMNVFKISLIGNLVFYPKNYRLVTEITKL